MDRPSENIPAGFILIDDDAIYNMVSTYIIRKVFGKDLNIDGFTNARDAIEFIASVNEREAKKNAIHVVLLDINMPEIHGWRVLEMLENLHLKHSKNWKIFMVSSSINPEEKKRALNHPLVEDFWEKPISIEKLETWFSMQNIQSENKEFRL